MKVGIITVHGTVNAGASLQTHALYHKLTMMGHSPMIINYRPERFSDMMDDRRKWHWKGVKTWLKALILYRRLQKKHDKQILFEKKYYPDQTRRYNSAEELKSDPPQMDCYICGSDQIWNPRHIEYDDSFFLGFVKSGASKIAYAASIGEDNLTEKDVGFLKNSTEGFSSIGVREDSAVGIMRQCGRDATQNIDPTLLMTADYWRGIAEKPKRKLPEKFIFYYPLQHNPDEIHFIARLKEETGLPCVSVESALRPVKGTDIQIPDSSPNEFLWLMDNAQYVITNSFHGLVFAILFKKRIISFKNEYRNCRLDSLCRLFGLEGLQVDSMADFSMENRRVFWQKMAYSDNILLREREKAELYLRQVLK